MIGGSRRTPPGHALSSGVLSVTPRRRHRVVRPLVAGLLATGLLTVPVVDALATAPAVVDPAAPTAEEVEAQRAEAERLAAGAAAQEQAVADARARLVELSGQAGAAMERHQVALREAEAAAAERALQEERLAVAEAVLAGNRANLGRWVSQAYRDGGAMTDYEGWMTVLESESTDDLGQRLQMLQVVGRARGTAVEIARQAEAVQADATRRSRAAAQAAADAAARAEAARLEAERLVDEQRAQLSVLDELLGRLRADAGTAQARAEQLAIARAASEQRRMAALAQGARGANAVTGPVGACAGGPVHQYANGTIPLDVLCPLEGAPGHYLRADAAHSFSQLAAAYAAEFRDGLCITDSYRTVASQVTLFATKPDLAAVPGTSNHGWGTAVDLCGGVERFGTPQHEWMRANAPLYGWFHPSWAQPGGSRPEPWHWEYGG